MINQFVRYITNGQITTVNEIYGYMKTLSNTRLFV